MPGSIAPGAFWLSGRRWCRCGAIVGAILVLCGFGGIAAAGARLPQDCGAAAQAATARTGLPNGLLEAIGNVESGRMSGAAGLATPSPYAVDADGAGHWFGNEAEAADFVRKALASGARAVDVGCFQIDLEDHPDAFGSVRAAFDPAANADYAARFLVRLHARLGSWKAAIGAYHSATPTLSTPYARLVRAAWHGGSTPAPADPYVIRLVAARGALPKIVTP